MSPFSRGNEDSTSIVISAAFLVMVALFAAWGSSSAVEYLADEGAPGWIGLFINGAAMLAVSLVLVLASSMGDPSGFGFTRPKVGAGYGAGITWGLLLGLLAAVLNLSAGGKGLAPLQGLGFLQVVLLVWLLASVAEEVLVRGYVQSYLEPLSHIGFKAFGKRFSLPVVISALFFSLMHLILLRSGMSFATVYVIMAFMFFLGLVTAYQRERSGSILPSIVTHISFNVGGFIGGIIYAIIQVAVVGRTAAEVAGALVG